MLYKSDLPGPQGLKPASLLDHPGGTAEDVSFPKRLAKSPYRITMFSDAFESKGCCGVFRNPYILAAPIKTSPSASARQR